MAFSFLKRQEEPKCPPAPPQGLEAFKKFYDGETLLEVLDSFNQVCELASLPRRGRYPEFFPLLKSAYMGALPYKYKEIFKILEKKAGSKLYEKGTVGQTDRNRVLVAGAGPVGLRTAVEAQLLGSRTV